MTLILGLKKFLSGINIKHISSDICRFRFCRYYLMGIDLVVVAASAWLDSPAAVTTSAPDTIIRDAAVCLKACGWI